MSGWPRAIRRRASRDARGPAEGAAGTARDPHGGPSEAVGDILGLANEAAPPLRSGLSAATAAAAAPALRRLLCAPAVAITDVDTLLHWEGDSRHHDTDAARMATLAIADGRPHVERVEAHGRRWCPLSVAVAVPVVADAVPIGTLQAWATTADPALTDGVEQLAAWMSTQIELSQMDAACARAARAELRALRAQISPHFLYNALTAIAGQVHADADHARELLLDFADFTRYSFRFGGQFTTLAEELRAIEVYLGLERTRLGDRLRVTVQVAPETLPVAMPYLALQPLVENAVRHGLEPRTGVGHLELRADDAGSEVHVTVTDDGLGADPDALAAQLAGHGPGDHVGLVNVDQRLRTVFGAEYGLIVETAPRAGTRVSLRIPKFRPDVRASAARERAG